MAVGDDVGAIAFPVDNPPGTGFRSGGGLGDNQDGGALQTK